MELLDMVYEICQTYVADHRYAVDEDLWSKVDGYRRARDLKSLSTCSLHFNRLSHSVNDWRFLRQVEAFFKKNALFADKKLCKDAATLAFKEAEKQCSDTNLRLRALMRHSDQMEAGMHEKVLAMQRYISTVLGPFDDFLEALPTLVKVTPGATAQTKRRASLPQLKLRLQLYSTSAAKVYITSLYNFFGFEGMFVLKTTHTNRIELVPKNWKTDRTIACEPEGNLPLQLAFDTYAKRKLRRFRIDLSDQSANQKKACHASVYNDYVTVDFQAASDTIAQTVVEWLFPPEWYGYLLNVRSPCYRGVMGQGEYQKFSSMGNGSTFCIETLLFAAVCHAVGSRSFLVYGDDVIVEKKYFEDFLALARFLGFTVNVDKTFADGPFRESCGGDYFNGIDVTPVFIRSIDKRKAVLCHLVNSLGSLTFPGSLLEAKLLQIAVEHRLPLAPWTESTMSGVWIRPRMARNLGLLRTRILREDGPRLDYFRSYVAETYRRKFPVRGYYLWFLYKNAQAFFAGPWEESAQSVRPSRTSSAPVFTHRYVRKWVSWFRPAQAMPDHVILWSENFATALNAVRPKALRAKIPHRRLKRRRKGPWHKA